MVVILMGRRCPGGPIGRAFTQKLPFYQERLTTLYTEAIGWLQGFGIELSRELLIENFNPGEALAMAGTTLAGLGGVLSNSFLIILTVIFILAEASSFPLKLRDVLRDADRSMPYFARFAENVNRYIAIKTSVSIVTGLVITIYLAVLGVDFPVLWGLLAFLLNFVPAIGSIIAAIPALLLALVQLGPGLALLTAAGYAVVNIGMGNVVEPRFMGRGLGFPRSSCSFPGVVGMGARTGGHVAVGAVDHDRENRTGGKPLHRLACSSARASSGGPSPQGR